VAVIAGFRIDTSAAARMPLPAVADRLEPLITSGLVATCAGLDAEALHSTRSPAEYEQVRSARSPARAGTGQGGTVDLLTAVLAAEHGMTVVHDDADFELAAEVLEFEHRWVLSRGGV
jgi:predicted nucleic acid-binding protein